jgi:hypothetical protein
LLLRANPYFRALWVFWKQCQDLALWISSSLIFPSPIFRSLLVPECHSEPAAISKQSHSLLQLYTALLIRRGKYWSNSGTNHQVLSYSQLFYRVNEIVS